MGFFSSSDVIASFKIYNSVKSALSWAVGSDVCFSFGSIFCKILLKGVINYENFDLLGWKYSSKYQSVTQGS